MKFRNCLRLATVVAALYAPIGCQEKKTEEIKPSEVLKLRDPTLATIVDNTVQIGSEKFKNSWWEIIGYGNGVLIDKNTLVMIWEIRARLEQRFR